MSESIDELLADFTGNTGASEEVLKKVESELGRSLPSDYRSFLQKIDGGEGFVGPEYLILWKADELKQFNDEYEVSKYAPGLLLFASNGGGEGFAFDESLKIVQVPFIGMSPNEAIHVADNFIHLLQRMNQSDGSLF